MAKISSKHFIFFVNIVGKLGIDFVESLLVNSVEITDAIVKIPGRYRTHLSMRMIKKHAKVSYEEIHKDITKLDSKKACQDTEIPSHIIKENLYIFLLSFFFIY